MVALTFISVATLFESTSLANAETVVAASTNIPAVLGSASVSLTEINSPVKANGKLSISDEDNPPRFVAQKNVTGNYGTFSINVAGTWSYVASSPLDQLNVGKSVSDSFTVASVDGTTTTVQITINGSNDEAILGSANVVLTETDEVLRTGGTLSIRDVDSPETFLAQSNVKGTNGTFNIDSDGAWAYVSSTPLDELKAGESATDSFPVVSSDGTSTVVVVTIKGSNDPAILGSANVTLSESNEPLSSSGTLSIRDVDSPETFQAKRNIKGKFGTFNIDTAGAWNYATNGALDKLGEGQRVDDTFAVSSSDGSETSVLITINGTNDPAVLDAPSVTLKETNEPLKASGKVNVRDVDNPDTFVAQGDVKGKYGTFGIDSSGRWNFVANSAFDELSEGESISDNFSVLSDDGTATSVTVIINGTNDPAKLGAPIESVQEANEPLRISGKVSIFDPDNPETFEVQSDVNGKNGSFSIDSAGAWTYVANSAFDELNEGKSLSDKFMVRSADGTKSSVTVIINGTNDAAILSTGEASLVETNAPLSASGALTISDVDSPPTFLANRRITGKYGTLSIDSKGGWKYVTNGALDELQQDQTVVDTIAVFSSDGTGTTVKITITGTNDPAILGSAKSVLSETNEPLSTSGTLTIKDVDSPETFVEQTNVIGTNGTFSVDAGGNWKYVANTPFDELNVGDSISDSFTVSSADGTETKVEVTIKGTNDPAVLGAPAVVVDETNEPLKLSGTLSIRDPDSPETFEVQSNVKGKYGAFSIDSAGAWKYDANSAFDELNVGKSISDTFTVSSADGTKSKVQFTINGVNDPAILSSATIALDETNEPLKTAGKLDISDVDSPEKFVEQSNFKGTYGTFNVDATGKWTYVANSAFDELNVGRSITDNFSVSSDDGTQTHVKVTINGTNDPAILGSGYELLTESNETLTTSGTLSIRDVDNTPTFVVQEKVKGKTGFFSIDATGKWTYVSDGSPDWISEGQTDGDIFNISSSDGTMTAVQVAIKGTNDPAILGSASLVLDETNEPLKPTGKLSIKDVDSPETFVVQDQVKGTNGTFSIDASGQWIYVANSAFDEMNIDKSVSDGFTISSSDGTLTSVHVTIVGTNDPAVITVPRVLLKETNEALRATGKAGIYDVDSPEYFLSQRNAGGKYGTFSIDAEGAWVFAANEAFDRLGADQSISDSFKITSADATSADVLVIINGSNDPASLGSPDVILRETNSPRIARGKLNIIDLDSPMSVVAQSDVKGKNGTFNIDNSGRWSYVARSAFDDLEEGQSVSDRFIVVSKDGTSSSVHVTIQGSEESKFDGGWFGLKAGLNHSNLNGMESRDAFTYGIEEGTTWKLGVLQLGIYGSLEFNNTASGPVNYGSNVITFGTKLGLPLGNWQPYGKLSMARTNGSEAANDIGASHVGHAVGLEYKIGENVSITGEYSSSYGDTFKDGVENKLRNKNITLGLNFYFGVSAPIFERAPDVAPAPVSQSIVEPPTSDELDIEPSFGPKPTPAPKPEPEATPSFVPSFGPATEPETAPKPASEINPAFVPAFGSAPVTEPAPKPAAKPAPEPAFAPAFAPATEPEPATEPAPDTAPTQETKPAFTPAFAPAPAQ